MSGRPLPLLQPPSGCGLTADELAEQVGRARALRGSVHDVSRSGDALRILLGEDVDAALLGRFVETERRCCPLLDVGYDEPSRVLAIGAETDDGRELVDLFAGVFAG